MVWQKQEVRDHRSGITDIVKNSPPSFQEECVNLIHDNKEGNLEQRAGSTYFTAFDAPYKIRQIFQLEDYIFAYCYDDPVTPGDDIDGRIYWVLEDGTSTSWTEVETQGTDTTLLIRLRDTKGRGVDISIPEGDPDLRDLVKTISTTSAQAAPVLSLQSGYIRVLVREANVAPSGYYNSSYTYEDLKLALESLGAGWTVSYSPLTTATTEVHFSGSFELDTESTGVGQTTGRWTGGFEPAYTKEGNLSISELSGHIYLSLEPFDKSFAPNSDDPYAENPDAFPPDNDREPQRKLYLQNHDNVITPVLQNSENSRMYLGYDYSETTSTGTSDTSYRYARQKVRISETASSASPDIGQLSVYYERGFAPSPVVNQIGLYVLNTLGSARIDDHFSWTTFQPPYGTFAAYVQRGQSISSHISQLRSLLNQKATDNPYGSPFRFIINLDEGNSSDFAAALQTNTTSGGNISPTLIRALPPEATGNVFYAYASYMRTQYQGQDEGAPKTYINDHQVNFLSYPAISAIDDQQIRFDQVNSGTNNFLTDKYPTIWLGRHKNYLDDESLHIKDTDSVILSRTESNGTTAYIVQEILALDPIGSNPPPDSILYNNDDWDTNVGEVVELVDVIDDPTLIDLEPAYYNGGVASHDSLPQAGAYYSTIVNQTGYHANIIGNVQRVYESPPGVPYAAPGLFFQDFDDQITGISHFSNKPIIFTPNSIWRWEGTNGSTGDGRVFTRVVSDEFGCIANQSIVRTNVGLFFWSKTGIVFTDGLRALRVTEHLIDRYAKWLSYVQDNSEDFGPEEVRGTYDEINRRVLWSSVDEDGYPVLIVLDIFDGISDKMPVFIERGNTNVSYNGSSFDTVNMYQTSAIYFSEDKNLVFRGQDKRLLTVSPTLTSDEYWDGTSTLDIPISPYLKSVAFDYNDRGNRKWTSTIMYGFEDLAGNGVSLQPLGWNDLSGKSHNLYPMVNYQHTPWSSDYAQIPQMTLEQFFLHTDVSFNSTALVSYKRKFPRNKIRNVFKQIGFEKLPIDLGDLNEGSGNVTNIEVGYVGSTGRNLVEIRITVSNTSDNSLVDMGVDSSGAFYASWVNQEERVKIHNLSLDGSVYTMQVYTSDEVVSDFNYQDAWPVKVFRVFSDQKIKLSDYTLTYKVTGDKTHGLVRSEEQGGFNG